MDSEPLKGSAAKVADECVAGTSERSVAIHRATGGEEALHSKEAAVRIQPENSLIGADAVRKAKAALGPVYQGRPGRRVLAGMLQGSPEPESSSFLHTRGRLSHRRYCPKETGGDTRDAEQSYEPIVRRERGPGLRKERPRHPLEGGGTSGRICRRET